MRLEDGLDLDGVINQESVEDTGALGDHLGALPEKSAAEAIPLLREIVLASAATLEVDVLGDRVQRRVTRPRDPRDVLALACERKTHDRVPGLLCTSVALALAWVRDQGMCVLFPHFAAHGQARQGLHEVVSTLAPLMGLLDRLLRRLDLLLERLRMADTNFLHRVLLFARQVDQGHTESVPAGDPYVGLADPHREGAVEGANQHQVLLVGVIREDLALRELGLDPDHFTVFKRASAVVLERSRLDQLINKVESFVILEGPPTDSNNPEGSLVGLAHDHLVGVDLDLTHGIAQIGREPQRTLDDLPVEVRLGHQALCRLDLVLAHGHSGALPGHLDHNIVGFLNLGVLCHGWLLFSSILLGSFAKDSLNPLFCRVNFN